MSGKTKIKAKKKQEEELKRIFNRIEKDLNESRKNIVKS